MLLPCYLILRVVVLCNSILSLTYGFSIQATTTRITIAPQTCSRSPRQQQVASMFRQPAPLHAVPPNDSDVDAITETETALFPDATFHDFVLEEHRPLGCTVEESLAHPMDKHVFVSKVSEDGFAEAAGLQVGDVLVAISGIFGDLTPVMGVGIEQVRSLVTGRLQEESLHLRVARGTCVLEDHETALVDLCMTPGANDQEIEDCVDTILNVAYYNNQNDNDATDNDNDEDECDSDTECLLDDMMRMWDEDSVTANGKQQQDDTEADDTASAVLQDEEIKPWSSRSSPSGTYVRDPATGKMVNIDK